QQIDVTRVSRTRCAYKQERASFVSGVDNRNPRLIREPVHLAEPFPRFDRVDCAWTAYLESASVRSLNRDCASRNASHVTEKGIVSVGLHEIRSRVDSQTR